MNISKKVLTSCAAAALVVSMSASAFAAALQVKNDTVEYKGVKVTTPLISGSRGGATVDEKVNMQLLANSWNSIANLVTLKTPIGVMSGEELAKESGSMKDAKENVKEFADYLGARFLRDQEKVGQKTPYTLNISYELKTGTDDNTLSLLQKVESYTGGAHANTSYVPVNYDLRTGKAIKLADIFADGADYKSRLMTLMQIQAKGSQRIITAVEKAAELNKEPAGLYMPKEITGNEKFYVNARVGELNVFYNPGEIAPISEGTKTFTFGLDTIADIIRLGK